MSLPIRRIDGQVKVGLFAENSHRIVECNDCVLQPEWNTTCISIIKDFICWQKVSVYSDDDKRGDIRHLVVRQVEDCIYFTVVSCRKINLDYIGQKLKENFSSYVLYLNVNNMDNNVILGDKWYKIDSCAEPEKVQGLVAQIHPAGFFQVNDYIKDKIYSRAVEYVLSTQPSVVVDAYSGAGIMSAFFAKYAPLVYAIEINEQAHESSIKLAKDNKINNLYSILGDVKDEIGNILQKHKGEKVTVVLDPPRSGCNEKALEAICENGITDVVYVSCNPATLARDLKYLKNFYEITSVTPYDMFPQTCSVETLVLLKRKEEVCFYI